MPDDLHSPASCTLSSPGPHGLLPLLLDAVTVPTYVHAGGPILHANPAMLRLAGHGLDALRGFHHSALCDEAGQPGLQAYGEACLSPAGDPPAMELQLITAHGATRQVEINGRRVMFDGQPCVIVTCQDLSDIQHVQSSLLQVSQLLNQIINGGPVATFVIDKDHRVTHWNKACERLTGRLAWEMLGRTEYWRAFYNHERPLLADMIVDGVKLNELKNHYQDAVKPSQELQDAYEGETFFPALKEGEEGRWLFFTAAPLRDPQGELIGAIETLQDVTQRRKAEEELTRHRNQLEQLVEERSAELGGTVRQLAAFMENSPIGIMHTMDGQVVHNNQTLAAIFGLPGGSAVGMAGADFFLSAEDHEALTQLAKPRLAQGLPVQHEMWLRHSDGSALWVQMIAYVADIQDLSAGAWWLVQDRTEFRRTQDELQSNFARIQETNRKLEEAQNQLLQSDKMASIGQLAAGVAHEINNPIGFVGSNLNSLKTYVQDLIRLIDGYQQAELQGFGAETRATLAGIKKSVEMDYLREDLPQLLSESEDGLARVKKIVQDLKDFSRVDQADWQEADLNTGLESTLNVVMHEVKYKAEVIKQLKPLPPVRCLAAQLNQVFMNLIVNASHAIDGRGIITLSSGTQDDWVWVEVRDSGCGMNEEVQRRIFEPFFTTKPVGKGTGLGLSLSFSIVQRHGGTIRLQSAPGQGSAFRVWIPVAGPATEGGLLTPPGTF
ncbi:MAG TPA: PAS domain S-box protein [Ideonella sp.]|uniref:PAS domain-containing sensor histidine kinase n=1 Tax=Ideonella sp. TaxID=1929293 RepID=UPI002BFE24C8|nr:PAS domain S-box protein [Ideonella sp.]HSI49022.1 PAS domain S-box protein [Ideonella sp.]